MILATVTIVGVTFLLALNMKYHFVGFTGITSVSQNKHTGYANEETWSWTDYTGRDRSITVHRKAHDE